MEPERWARTDELFNLVIEQPPQERAAFLREACHGDDQLRQEIESLLAYEERAQSFLKEPAMEVGARLVAARPREVRLRPGDQLGPYRILELLGAGGMGEVYKAADTRLGRVVALKLISAAVLTGAEAPERFLREARAASALNHPNICTVHDIGEHQGEPFLVMELLEGQSLNKLVAGQPLPVGQLLELGVQIAEALEAAHAHGIVHLDIKPANVFVTSRGQAKILDFGLAKLAREQEAGGVPPASVDANSFDPVLTRYAGTPGYMSPEQVRGEALDARIDLFSVGIVLCEMATGQPPFRGGSSSKLLAAIVDEEPVPVRGAGARVPPALARIIGKALQKERGYRYQTASELVSDLRRLAKARARRPAYLAACLLLGLATLVVVATLVFRRPPSLAPSPRDWVQITNFSDSVVDPGLSRDGTQLAFIRGSSTHTPLGQLYVMRLPDGEPRRLTSDERMKMGPYFRLTARASPTRTLIKTGLGTPGSSRFPEGRPSPWCSTPPA